MGLTKLRLSVIGALAVILAGMASPLGGQGLPRILERLKIDVAGLEPFVEPAPLTSGLENAVSGIGIAVLDLAEIGFTSAATLPREPDGVLALGPGAWELVSESVSLLPGATAPIQAEGFVLAPMIGPRADLLRAVLSRAYGTPDITLDDVQTVVWAIMARARISSLAPAFRRSAERLLTEAERTSLDGRALGPLPDDLRDEVSTKLPTSLASLVFAESALRVALANPDATFADLATIAVTSGEPESIMGDKDLLVERWSYHPDGYFVRVLPTHYRTTAIQVVVPTGQRPAIQRDPGGRIIRVAYPGGLEIAAEYDDTIPGLVLPGDSGVNGYAFKTLAVSQSDPSQPGGRRTATRRASGWTLVGQANGLAQFGATGAGAMASDSRYGAAENHYQAGWWVKRGLSYVGGDSGSAVGPLSADPEAVDETFFRDAVTRAFAAGAADTQWARAAVSRLTQSFDWVYCALSAASCQPPDAPARRTATRFDPAAAVAVPGRQGSQKLAFTGRIAR